MSTATPPDRAGGTANGGGDPDHLAAPGGHPQARTGADGDPDVPTFAAEPTSAEESPDAPADPSHDPDAHTGADEGPDTRTGPRGGPDARTGRATAPGRRRYGLVAPAITAVLGLLLGYAAGWLVPKLSTPGDDSVDAGFSRDMTSHHAQAVEMGLIGFQRATDPAVRQIAVDIATTQQGEIGMMHAWLDRWRLDPTGSAPAMAWMPDSSHRMSAGGLMPGMANAGEMSKLRTTTGSALDVLFLQLMIRHHLGGVHMIDAVLAAGAEPEVLHAAQTMKNVQQTELANLEDLLARHGGKPLPTG